MKKYKICKILLVILAIFLCVAFYELLGICVAYKKQPEVSNTTKKETKNGSWNECSENTERAVIIEKNPEALLQRVRLIKNAKKEIILSTFAFQSDESGKLIYRACFLIKLGHYISTFQNNICQHLQWDIIIFKRKDIMNNL